MTPLVIDASVAAGIAIVSQRTPAIVELVRGWDQHVPLAPYVFSLETPWLLLRHERRTQDRGFARAALLDLADLHIAVADALPPPELDAALDMAIARNMGFYDAMYIMLAAQSDAALASRDGRMVDVARAFGLQVLDLR